MNITFEELNIIDEKLSKRHIDLDPGGYFIIFIDTEAGLIFAKHFTNIIDERGLAIDPETGRPIPAKGKVERKETKTYKAKTAKEMCVKIFEEARPCKITMLDHAAYLGREFLRAEIALLNGKKYIQD